MRIQAKQNFLPVEINGLVDIQLLRRQQVPLPRPLMAAKAGLRFRCHEPNGIVAFNLNSFQRCVPLLHRALKMSCLGAWNTMPGGSTVQNSKR